MNHQILLRFERGVGEASKLASRIGGIFLLLMLLASCANIGMRLLGLPFRGAIEINGYLCAVAVGLCMPQAQRAGIHISGGIWEECFSPKNRKRQHILITALSAALLALVSAELLDLALYAYGSGETIEGFPFSFFALAVLAAAGFILQACVLACTFFTLCLGLKDRK